MTTHIYKHTHSHTNTYKHTRTDTYTHIHSNTHTFTQTKNEDTRAKRYLYTFKVKTLIHKFNRTHTQNEHITHLHIEI